MTTEFQFSAGLGYTLLRRDDARLAWRIRTLKLYHRPSASRSLFRPCWSRSILTTAFGSAHPPPVSSV